MASRTQRLTVCCLGFLIPASCAAFEQTFTFEEHLGYAWEADAVHRTIQVPEAGRLFADRAALYHNGAPVPVQFDAVQRHPDASLRSAAVWFRTALPTNGKESFVLKDAVPPEALRTDLTVTTRGNVLELRNAFTAVRLPASRWNVPDGLTKSKEVAAVLAARLGVPPDPDGRLPGPLLGVRMPSGAWAAPCAIEPSKAFLGYTTEVLARGPVFTRVRVRYAFAAKGAYALTVTLRAADALVRFDEAYEKAGRLVVDLYTDLRPTRVAHKRSCRGGYGDKPLSFDKSARLVELSGWDIYIPGWAPVIALDGGASGDFLGLLSTDMNWRHPSLQRMTLTAGPGPSLLAEGSLASGTRHWGIYAGTAEAVRKMARTDEPVGKAFQRWWNRRVALPLDKFVSWRLVWPGMETLAFPHTFFDRKEMEEIRRRFRAAPEITEFLTLDKRPDKFWWWCKYRLTLAKAPKERLEALEACKTRYGKKGLPWTLLVAAYLYTGDDAYLRQFLERVPGRRPEDSLLDQLDRRVKLALTGCGQLEGPLNSMILSDWFLLSYQKLELLLGSDLRTSDEKKRVLTKLAFMAYLLNDPMYMPPSYPKNRPGPYPGYETGTPNQRHHHWANMGIVACMLPGHPDREKWIRNAVDQHLVNMPWILAENGVFQESPFYTARDTSRFGPFDLAMTRAGVKDLDAMMEREKRGFRYLADMLTPPDARLGGRRVYYPFGRAYTGVVDPTFMIGVQPWASSDEDYGRLMRWCWEAQGKYPPDVMGTTGGRDVSFTLIGFSRLLQYRPLDRCPLTSRRHVGMGVVFRSQTDSTFESNAVFRHGPFAHELSFAGENEGGVYLYGKGAPLLPLSTNISAGGQGRMTFTGPAFGNRLQFLQGGNRARGTIAQYALLGDQADHAVGITNDKCWRRDVLLAKDHDRGDPVYLLVHDEPSRKDAATALHWWIASGKVAPNGYEKPGVVTAKITDSQWLAKLGRNWAEAAAAGAPPPPKLTGQRHHFTGQCRVDLDLYIAAPTEPKIVTDAACVAAHYLYSINPKLHENLHLVRIEQSPCLPYLTLFIPRWPGSEAPTYATIADGKGVLVRWGNRSDRLFLGPTPIAYADDAVKFEGRAGYVRQHGAAPLRMMVAEGKVAAAGVTLTSQEPAALVYDGDEIIVTSPAGADPLIGLAPAMKDTLVVRAKSDLPR